jgi:hypothetical protein
VSAEVFAKLVAGTICLGMWAPIVLAVGLAAHARMRGVERREGRRAVPANEGALLCYAIASFAWPTALGVTVVGLVRSPWARVGRNASFILLGHLSAVALGTIAIALLADPRDAGLFRLAIAALVCGVLVFGGLIASVLGWRWAGARGARIAREGAKDARIQTVGIRTVIALLAAIKLLVCAGIFLFVAFVPFERL